MSGILQQGYSMGYVFAACANLGVGGSVESWKTVFGKEESAFGV
jgi:SHS family lactate transporter-like MFS transporter